ncbi:hypothetical protein MQE36_07420 [Zhouia spongiae]|uniref:Lipocalin-like domain-containing protein n=1 Tax=Zhouia spongiae TaxID=2202721 RepID=A0ABY3YR13_9FLAO|nr:hypothetical protein [Zhouia spongiae]UNZ00164.1 hypothetical protein MQE36_07420 [Zhouia spongiae]
MPSDKPLKVLLVLITAVFLSCCNNNNLKNRITNNWQVTKMQRYVKVTSNRYTTIDIDISPKTSYNFKENGKTEIITQLGSKMNGSWKNIDSTIIIRIKGEKRLFKVDSITDVSMLLSSDQFKFYLKKKNQPVK